MTSRIKEYRVTIHAMERFRERASCRDGFKKIQRRIVSLIKSGTTCKLDKETQKRLIRQYSGQKHKYVKSPDGMTFVLAGKRVVTCFFGDPKGL